jgi:hypothetical protein
MSEPLHMEQLLSSSIRGRRAGKLHKNARGMVLGYRSCTQEDLTGSSSQVRAIVAGVVVMSIQSPTRYY